MPPRPFTHVASRHLLHTPIFEVREDRTIHPVTGREGRYVVLENPNWVNVIAVTEDARLIMVRQWRHGVRRVALELPAGLVETGESAQEAAARELMEETGYEAARWAEIGEIVPNQAYQSNLCTTLLAEGCRKTGEGGGDGSEDIEVVLYGIDEIPGLIAAGELRNAMTYCALFWWLRQAGGLDWSAVEVRRASDG